MKNIKAILLLCLLSVLNNSQAKEKVIWATENFPPYYIDNGPGQNTGIADVISMLLQKELPEFEHKNQLLPALRIRKRLNDGEKMVSVSFIKDRSMLPYAQYSVATLLVPAMEITLRRQVWEDKWKSAPIISLEKLLSDGGTVGIAEQRRYGKKFDALLLDKKRFPSGTSDRVGDHYQGLAEMVALRRVDATIGYSSELRYAQLLNPSLNNLVNVPAVENTTRLYAYAIIPRNAWGDEFKVKLDRAILKVRGSKEYKTAMTRWFGESKAWEEEYKNRFLKGKMDGANDGL